LIGEEPGQTNPDHKFNTIERWIFGDEREGFLGGKSKPAAKKPVVTQTDEDGDEIPF
jgi:hypothetical protein